MTCLRNVQRPTGRNDPATTAMPMHTQRTMRRTRLRNWRRWDGGCCRKQESNHATQRSQSLSRVSQRSKKDMALRAAVFSSFARSAIILFLCALCVHSAISALHDFLLACFAAAPSCAVGAGSLPRRRSPQTITPDDHPKGRVTMWTPNQPRSPPGGCFRRKREGAKNGDPANGGGWRRQRASFAVPQHTAAGAVTARRGARRRRSGIKPWTTGQNPCAVVLVYLPSSRPNTRPRSRCLASALRATAVAP